MIKVFKDKKYVPLENRVLQDRRLSFGARGLYAYIESLELDELDTDKDLWLLAKGTYSDIEDVAKLLGELIQAGVYQQVKE